MSNNVRSCASLISRPACTMKFGEVEILLNFIKRKLCGIDFSKAEILRNFVKRTLYEIQGCKQATV